MSLRDSLNQNPAVTTAVTVGILVLMLAILAWNLRGGARSDAGGVPVFFTADAGQTWTRGTYDDMLRRGPDGLPRVRAVLYLWPGESKPFAGYLERFTPDVLTAHEQGSPEAFSDPAGQTEVARPGTDQWFPLYSERGQQIAAIPRRNDTSAVSYSP